MFVAHLIATAGHVPQTRSLRRATPADAQTAYSTNQQRSIAPARGRVNRLIPLDLSQCGDASRGGGEPSPGCNSGDETSGDGTCDATSGCASVGSG